MPHICLLHNIERYPLGMYICTAVSRHLSVQSHLSDLCTAFVQEQLITFDNSYKMILKMYLTMSCFPPLC